MLDAAIVRMLDANANRAREGLRTLEDAARFVLDDAVLASRGKAIRHGLRDALDRGGLQAVLLAASRDTAGDVGVAPTVTAAAAPRHGDLSAMVLAAGHRATEALRVLAESCRLHDTTAAAAPGLERLRYLAYDLQRDVLGGLAGRERGAVLAGEEPAQAAGELSALACPQFALCVLITESLCRRPWLEVAEAAIAGGADCLQLREKTLDDGELLQRATRLTELCLKKRVACIINDRVDIAILAKAHGVHLGQGDVPPAAARRLAGTRLWLGVSTHDEGEARAAIAAGADLCGVGAMFATSTKVRPPSGPAYLKRYLELCRTGRNVPHLAIGGITPENIGELAAAGCRGVAVSSVVCGAEEPGRVCEGLRRGLGV